MSEDESVERLSVAEAAERLGVTRDAIHKRIKRRSIRHEQDTNGRYYVYVDTSTSGLDTSADTSNNESMVEVMREMMELTRERIDYLERQVEEEREARRRADTLLAQLMQRIPELEAPREPTKPEPAEPTHPDEDGPESPQTHYHPTQTPTDAGVEAQGASERPWWRFWG